MAKTNLNILKAIVQVFDRDGFHSIATPLHAELIRRSDESQAARIVNGIRDVLAPEEQAVAGVEPAGMAEPQQQGAPGDQS